MDIDIKTKQMPSILKGVKDAILDEEMANHYVLILTNGVDDQDVEKYKNIFSSLEKMLEVRLQTVGLTLSAGLFMWICILTNGIPGRVVMWVWTLANIAKEQNKKRLTLRDWALLSGLVSDDEYDRCWKDQKQDGMNLLDHPDTWKELVEYLNG